MRVPVEPTHCCHGRLHAQHIVVMVVAAARAARLRIDRLWGRFHARSRPRGLSRSHRREALVTGHLTGRRSGSMLWSSAVAVAAAPRAVHFLHRGEGGGVPAERCPLPTRRPPVCGGVVGSEQRRPPPQLLPLPPASRCQSTHKKKKEPPRHTTRLHGHTRPPTLATQQKEQATTIPHPRPTRATPPPSTPALTRAAPRCDTTQPSPRPRGSARAPPRWPQGSPTTAGHTAFLTNRDRVNSPQAGSILVPTARFRRPTDSNTAVRPHDAPSARPLFTRFRPPANPGHRAPPTPRPPRVQGGHTLTAGRRRRPLI